MRFAHRCNHEPALAARIERVDSRCMDSKMKTRPDAKAGFIGAGTVTATFGRHLINAGRGQRGILFMTSHKSVSTASGEDTPKLVRVKPRSVECVLKRILTSKI